MDVTEVMLGHRSPTWDSNPGPGQELSPNYHTRLPLYESDAFPGGTHMEGLSVIRGVKVNYLRYSLNLEQSQSPPPQSVSELL